MCSVAIFSSSINYHYYLVKCGFAFRSAIARDMLAHFLLSSSVQKFLTVKLQHSVLMRNSLALMKQQLINDDRVLSDRHVGQAVGVRAFGSTSEETRQGLLPPHRADVLS